MDVVRICSELVKIKSENPPGDTTEVAQYIASLLDGLGIRSHGGGLGYSSVCGGH